MAPLWLHPVVKFMNGIVYSLACINHYSQRKHISISRYGLIQWYLFITAKQSYFYFFYLLYWFTTHLNTRRLWVAYKVKSSKPYKYIYSNKSLSYGKKLGREATRCAGGKVGSAVSLSATCSIALPHFLSIFNVTWVIHAINYVSQSKIAHTSLDTSTTKLSSLFSPSLSCIEEENSQAPKTLTCQSYTFHLNMENSRNAMQNG